MLQTSPPPCPKLLLHSYKHVAVPVLPTTQLYEAVGYKYRSQSPSIAQDFEVGVEDLCFKGAAQGIYENTINRERLEGSKRGKEMRRASEQEGKERVPGRIFPGIHHRTTVKLGEG